VWVTVGHEGEFLPGEAREVFAAGHVLAVCRVDDTLYATDGICLHRGGPLGQGDLDGFIITCPNHGWEFDVRSGVNVGNPAARVRTYPVRVADGAVQVDL
jgi:nitrite reductase/ring-hydroxylating ferredoxin subunit